MPHIDWVAGVLIAFFVVVTILLFRVVFGSGDSKREREELRRSAKRAAEVRE